MEAVKGQHGPVVVSVIIIKNTVFCFLSIGNIKLQILICYETLIINKLKYVGFEVLTAVSTKMAVFWVVAPCSLVEVYQCFRGPCCLRHQGDE
jgi:hypothetical protein